MNEICKRCKCCENNWIDCYDCEDGLSYHDCGEDVCVCIDKEPNVKCDIKGMHWKTVLGEDLE